MTATTMQAAQYDRYGPPEVLTVRTVPTPTPARGEVLVRVHGSSVNLGETLIRSGAMRPVTGWRFPKATAADFAGEVAAVGPGVDRLHIGQPVWGYLGGLRGGAAAEYVVAKQAWAAPAPASVDLATAAALPTVAMAALQALRDTVKLTAGERLLVIGASGGVGSAAVQLGRAMGATVTAVAGADSAELCRQLGAERVIDYATTEPSEIDEDFHVILDCHGTALRAYRRLLRRGGRMVTLASSGAGAAFALLSTVLPGPRVRLFTLLIRRRRDDLETLARYVDRGELQPVVEQEYPVADIADAHRAAESGHARGKRLIRVLSDGTTGRPETGAHRTARPLGTEDHRDV
jgi:NADPH:quinone reductase-like Zn-dependent oxidoreductase